MRCITLMKEQIPNTGTIIADRYRLERMLGEGGLGRVFLATDFVSGQRVALKVLASREPESMEVESLRREFSLLAHLRHPNLVRVLDFGVVAEGGIPFLASEYIDGQDVLQASAAWSIEGILEAIARICRVVHYLHSRDVIHQDLKPSNILIPRGGTGAENLKILDFGLAQSAQGCQVTQSGGTLAYTAPEILLGRPATFQSDLYSMGIVAYQLLVRRLPFEDENAGFLIQKQLQGKPDLRPVERLRYGRSLVRMIESLLEKDPERRPDSPEEIIFQLSRTTGRDYSQKSTDLIESYFTSGRFVGRVREFELLQKRADRVRQTGRGSTLFLSGEAGLGKSRLFREFRIWALLEGWRVVEGSCRSGSDRSYAPFREILGVTERLPQANRAPGGSEEEAFRFEDFPRVTEVSSEAASPESAARSFRDRLTREIVRRLCDAPTLVLLHDFHWADEATITVLDYLSSDIRAHPILICVSLRPGDSEQGFLSRLMDQSRRQWTGETFCLDPLTEEAVEQLLTGIVGEADLGKSISNRVFKASGGNPFFLEEILKHWVDQNLLGKDLGRWRLAQKAIQSLDLPESVVVVLRSRIADLAPGGQILARWMAIFGRAIPDTLLRDLALASAVPFEESIAELIQREVARPVRRDDEQCYEFRHALIAETICADLEAAQRRQMHRSVGEALEGRYGDRAALQELAHHFTQGMRGRKATRYALKAAHACKADFALEAALRYYRFVLKTRGDIPPDDVCEAAIAAGDTACMLGEPKLGIRMLARELKSSRDLAPKALRARMASRLSYAYQCKGDLHRAAAVASRGMRLLRQAGDSRSARITKAFLLKQLAFCAVSGSRPEKGIVLLKQALEIISDFEEPLLTGNLYVMYAIQSQAAGNFDEGLKASRKAVEVLEPIKHQHSLAFAYSCLGYSLAAKGKLGRALTALTRAAAMAEGTRSVLAQATALSNLIDCYGRLGRPQEASGLMEKMKHLAIERGNIAFLAGTGVSTLGIQIVMGDYADAQKTLQELDRLPSSQMPVYIRAQCLCWSANMKVALGDYDSALARILELENLPRPTGGVVEKELAGVLKARIHHLSGRTQEALDLLQELDAAVTRNGRPYQMCVARLWLAEILLAQGEVERSGKHARAALRLASAMPALGLEAHAHLILGKVGAATFEGAARADGRAGMPHERESGAFAKARSELEAAVRSAETSQTAEMIWRSHYGLARLLESGGLADESLEHWRRCLETMDLLASRVPEEMRSDFRNMPERMQAQSDCRHRLCGATEEGTKGTSSAGELEEEHFRFLYRASHIIIGVRDLEELLEAVVDLLIQATGMERVMVFLRDATSDQLRLAKGKGRDNEVLEEAEGVSQSILEEAYRQGKPFVTADAGADLRAVDRKSVLAYKLRSLLCGPLKTRGRVLGVLYADHKAAAATLKESTINMFAAFCNLVAVAIDNALAHSQLVEEKRELELNLRRARSGVSEIVGKSLVVLALRERIAVAAASPLDVLIVGESGTGKELVAKALHRTGRRAKGRFVALDCGSLTESLVESELFGYRRGAFTGAGENRAGLLETASGGVIFLDEISNFSTKLQGKLLRFLQEREVRRLGETDARPVDVQVLAASNRDLARAISEGKFRKDLYYRLNAMHIRVPPLRERMEDIPLLVDWFLDRTVEAEAGLAKKFSSEARDTLCGYSYPGNVRQLKSAVQSSYYLAPGRIIGIEHLPEEFRREACTDAPGVDLGETAGRIYQEIISGRGTFDALVRKPFLDRELNVATVRQVLHFALSSTEGRYRDALSLLKVPDREYRLMLSFLKRHGIDLDFRPYRQAVSYESDGRRNRAADSRPKREGARTKRAGPRDLDRP